MPVTVALDGRGAERGTEAVIEGARLAAAFVGELASMDDGVFRVS